MSKCINKLLFVKSVSQLNTHKIVVITYTSDLFHRNSTSSHTLYAHLYLYSCITTFYKIVLTAKVFEFSLPLFILVVSS